MRSYSILVLKFSDEISVKQAIHGTPKSSIGFVGSHDPNPAWLGYPHESPPPRQQLASAVGIAVGDVCLSSMTTEEVTLGDGRMGLWWDIDGE